MNCSTLCVKEQTHCLSISFVSLANSACYDRYKNALLLSVNDANNLMSEFIEISYFYF